jgi:sugar-phosphatase
VTAELVARGKPHPDPFLLAAERLGVPPSACIVLEDSVNGIRAARAAGVGAVVGVSASALDQGCDAVIADLSCARWTGSGLEVLVELEA